PFSEGCDPRSPVAEPVIPPKRNAIPNQTRSTSVQGRERSPRTDEERPMTKQMVRVDVSFEHDRWLASTAELGCAAAYSTHREMRARYPHVLADRLDTDVASIDIEWRGLDPVVRELLDKSADSLRLAHEISVR